jgi:hypothetical protein
LQVRRALFAAVSVQQIMDRRMVASIC